MLYVIFIIVAPLLSFVVLQIMKNLGNVAGWIATGFSGVATLSMLLLFFGTENHVIDGAEWNWFSAGATQFTVAIRIDWIARLMLCMVAIVSFLVHLFSIAYMASDANFSRYFSYLGLFTFAMNTLLIADHLILLYIFWELVGISSYLLIGFWQEKPSAAKAAQKAFIVNRVGDAGFLIGIMAIYGAFGTTSLAELTETIPATGTEHVAILTLAGFGFLAGTLSKSAQLPLATWLPDAMEGPTPVSALIHAATMVAAGVYLLIRVHFMLPSIVLSVTLFLGVSTALLSAIAAITQYDIKKVLAYSTISQLGFMITAIGLGYPLVALVHLVTHAFFKALLFLGAGSVIHSLHALNGDPQDLRNMGGLAKKLPITHVALVIGGAALSGIPLFSGFLSKEAILLSSLSTPWVMAGLLMASALTAFYTTRLLWLCMWRKESASIRNLSKLASPHVLMRFSLIILSSLCLWFWFANSPLSMDTNRLTPQALALPHANSVLMTSIAIALLGAAFAIWLFNSERGETLRTTMNNTRFQKLSFHFFYIDKIVTVWLTHRTVKGTQALSRLERKWIDGLLHQLGIGVIIIAHATRWFDKYFVDGVIHLFTGILQRTGNTTGNVQGRAIQGMIAITFVILLSGLLIFYGIYLAEISYR